VLSTNLLTYLLTVGMQIRRTV